MKERPILFSGPMVRALLDGRKTQTRRVVNHAKYQPDPTQPPYYATGKVITGLPTQPGAFMQCRYHGQKPESADFFIPCPYGAPGDRLWVRETFMPMPHLNAKAFYRASDPLVGGKWKPSIFMPREASRITLEIAAVHVERLNQITALDAMAEGIEPMNYSGQDFWKNYLFKSNTPGHYIKAFRWQADSYQSLWESINGPGSWALNPWVWVITFRRVTLQNVLQEGAEVTEAKPSCLSSACSCEKMGDNP